jgi:hypothetical protein
MNKEQLQEQFSAFKAQVEDLREQLQKTGEKFLLENFKDTFKKYPQLDRVSWTQYTPYFNDGEECTFSSHHKWAEIEGEGLEYGAAEYEDIKKFINDFLSQFDDELLKSMFGDHAQIVITKEGISVEEYEHE